MLPQIQIILPRAPSQEYLVQYVRTEYQIWRQEQELKLPKWKPENIRFTHDPNWRNRLMSIQCVRDSMSEGPNTLSRAFWICIIAPLFGAGGLSFGYFKLGWVILK